MMGYTRVRRGLIGMGTEAESCHHGGIVVAWIEAAGWQVEGMSNFGPNLVSFLLTPRERRWYIMGNMCCQTTCPWGIR